MSSEKGGKRNIFSHERINPNTIQFLLYRQLSQSSWLNIDPTVKMCCSDHMKSDGSQYWMFNIVVVTASQRFKGTD